LVPKVLLDLRDLWVYKVFLGLKALRVLKDLRVLLVLKARREIRGQ
jgi:hypothetical protein